MSEVLILTEYSCSNPKIFRVFKIVSYENWLNNNIFKEQQVVFSLTFFFTFRLRRKYRKSKIKIKREKMHNNIVM